MNCKAYVGGAIKFERIKPILKNISFNNNSAVYGDDIGAYPIKVKLEGKDFIWLDDVPPGL